ncbi:hypothetical protein [Nocardiopsis tropica]|uniref:Uncharacterized protein n=1 Tax=Nocardiopsis tropica TaxID=109330 RepID=A0ABU7KR45_9ACTN|nr:hypothetical protein [Nocardiopsis umidischolae]MEE2051781.1 hypothetical protein [Nocardiopsis umidischolae]
MQDNSNDLAQLRMPLLAAVERLQQADSGTLADLISELLLCGRNGARIRPDEVMDQVDANLAQEDGETDTVAATVRLRLVAIYGGLRMDREHLDMALREALADMTVSVEEEETLERLYPRVRVETIEFHDQDD